MPDALAAILEPPGLIWMFLALGAAGLVRGFSGFGAAMIFGPAATHSVPTAGMMFQMVGTRPAATKAVFDPMREKLYRVGSYTVTTWVILIGLLVLK